MVRSSIKPFTLIEVLLALVVVSCIPKLSQSSYHYYKHNRFKHDVLSLKANLQKAHNLCLEMDTPIHIHFLQTSKGLKVQLKTSQDLLKLQFKKETLYPHLKRLQISGSEKSEFDYLCCFSGGLLKEARFYFEEQKQKYQFVLKGYPHIITLDYES